MKSIFVLSANRFLCNYLACLILAGAIAAAPIRVQAAPMQTITWTGTPDEILSLNRPYPLSAAASSGLPVNVRVESGPAVIADAKITVTAPGTVWVTAEQAGDGSHAPASLTRSFNARSAILTPAGWYARDAVMNVQVVGNYAYLATGRTGLQVVDVNNPANPVRIGGYNAGGSAISAKVQVVGQQAYLADGYAGLSIIDVRDPANPVRIGSYDTGGLAGDLQVVANKAFVADVYTGLHIIDVTHPASLERLGGYKTVSAYGVNVLGNYAYVTIGVPVS